MFELMVESSFSGAHQLLKSKSPCENMHGHNWKVQLFIKGEGQDDKVGWLKDFKEIKTLLKQELSKYDHSYINDVIQVSPTAENLAKIIYTNLKTDLPNISKISVWETEGACASYYE